MTAKARTRSRRPSAELSPEIEWYLESRGYERPTCEPLFRTEEPRNEPGAYFDPELVDAKIKALRALKHTKGRKWAGRPIIPTAVQVAYIIAPIFGWVRLDEDGDVVRIVREVYIETPRKSAKTTLGAALAMLLAFADGEPGAEVIIGAASLKQAQAAYGPLRDIASKSPFLKSAGVKATKAQIVRPRDESFIWAASSRGDLAHGSNPHAGLIDELHVHRDDSLLEAIESGTGARSQPLIIIITTADDGKTVSVYAQRRTFIEQVCKGILQAPTQYAVIFAAEESDDPFAETTWAKANPLYPVTPTPTFMKAAADKAKANPAALASFLRLNLGIRARGATAFFDIARWDRNASLVDVEELAGRRAFGGLDLGSTSDLTALVWLFPGNGYDVLARFWMPEAALPALDASTARSASGWVKDGWITLTPGEVTDYDFIRAQITRDRETFDVASIGFDRYNATQLVNDLLADEAPMERVGQGTVSLSAPLKEIDRLTKLGTARSPMFRHGGNPVLRWMADNTIVKQDSAGNVAPDKAKSMNKIDGISAAATAMFVALNTEPEHESAYESHGLEVV